jgi:hypothetical protein
LSRIAVSKAACDWRACAADCVGKPIDKTDSPTINKVEIPGTAIRPQPSLWCSPSPFPIRLFPEITFA